MDNCVLRRHVPLHSCREKATRPRQLQNPCKNLLDAHTDESAAKTEGGTTPSALYYYKTRSTRAALLCGAIGVLLGALH